MNTCIACGLHEPILSVCEPCYDASWASGVTAERARIVGAVNDGTYCECGDQMAMACFGCDSASEQRYGQECRLDERARIVAWLRAQRDERAPELCADLIERGEHLEGE